MYHSLRLPPFKGRISGTENPESVMETSADYLSENGKGTNEPLMLRKREGDQRNEASIKRAHGGRKRESPEGKEKRMNKDQFLV